MLKFLSKNIISTSLITSTIIVSSSLYAQSIDVTNVWQLNGAVSDINTSVFDNKCVDYIWRYDVTNSINVWQLHIANTNEYNKIAKFPTITTLKSGDGFWLKGNDTCNIDTSVTITTENNTTTSVLFNINLLSTGQTTSYRDGDDGYYKKGLVRSYTRNDSKEVVVDNITQIMWQDNSDVSDENMTKPWVAQENYDAEDYSNTNGDTATTYYSTLTLGGYSNWRLPSQIELKTIVDRSRSYLDIDPAFQNTTSNYYWCSTTFAYITKRAWNVNFGLGSDGYSNKNTNKYVRCARDN